MDGDPYKDTTDFAKEFNVFLRAKAIETFLFGVEFRDKFVCVLA